MRNNLSALNDYLFESIERIQSDELSDEELDREILRRLGVPERNFQKYGAEWPEEVYTILKGAKEND